QEIIDKITPIHDTILNCAPVVSQYAALSALQSEKRIVNNHYKIYKEQRERVGETLQKLNKYLTFIWPEGTYYFFPKIIGVSDSTSFCMDLFKKVRLAVVPGAAFGPGGEGHIRICFGRPTEDIAEGMKRLQFYFQN
ncbi:aminotransferase class I/II-fold pyridoxal phosphate-dependent enzyme, partial [Candidatus Roizmanbacteria bacterium]|nr:aminotransferase class I/II-fold pyridoxal phosphate-dependent enzyme [Candidatus Roizmanbacteria bacterium]